MEEKNTIPFLALNENGVPTLYVDEEPYLILGGELHNSSASSLDYMEEQVWPYLRTLHLNTVILPITWELMEAEEGIYDDMLTRELINQARREQVRLVLLWFGLWKNGESFYVPGWVKEDTCRFFRAEYRNGDASGTISPFCVEAVEKDKQAFCHLMQFLKDYDDRHTVIMVQVENEIGFLRSERDYSPLAERYFRWNVPTEVEQRYQVSGNWQEAFGGHASEAFMAYYYAVAVEKIASAGKKIHPLPIYVNAWIEQHPDRPGCYPSGGPVAKMIPMWKTAAPSIDLYAPDIYLPDFRAVCEEYSADNNPLFIPETGRNSVAASNVFYAFGKMNALGYSPFGIENLCKKNEESMARGQLEELNIASESFDDRWTAPYLGRSYEILQEMQEVLTARRGSEGMTAFIQQNSSEKGCILTMGQYDLRLDYLSGYGQKTGSSGIILREECGFYIIGCNVRFTILPKLGSDTFAGVSRYEEGEFFNGAWKRGRVLNGDERYDMLLKDMPEARYVKVYVRRF